MTVVEQYYHDLPKRSQSDTAKFVIRNFFPLLSDLVTNHQTYGSRHLENASCIAYLLRALYVEDSLRMEYCQHGPHIFPQLRAYHVSPNLVCSLLSSMVPGDVLAAVPSLYPILLLWWDVNRVDEKGMTLLNYNVSSRNLGNAQTLLTQFRASRDVSDSEYNNCAMLTAFSQQMPSKHSKAMTRLFMSSSKERSLSLFLDLCDALHTENLSHILYVLQQYKGKFDINSRRQNNASILGLIVHLEVLCVCLLHGFTVDTEEVIANVNFLPVDCLVYIVRHLDVHTPSILQKCIDSGKHLAMLDARRDRETYVTQLLDVYLPNVARDVCGCIAKYV